MLNFAMDVLRLQQQHSQLTYSLFNEGFLDEQFTQLQQLQDESNPDFVSEVVALFFDDSDRLLENLGKALEKEPIDYKKLDAHVHQFKGSSSSVGAHRVKNACIAFRAYCDENDRAGCIQCLQHMKHEYYLVKSKLQELFHLEEEILSAGGTLPLIE
ncbi:histidine-containing phosphotransfer protein 1 isoform X2 [Cryptomeria japonica]|nr:histidine-containing phosphotransfer protein 1 isoform X2 [Cryptomeria japonica]XP_057826700.1 histidine-containing phosphotransfer protein 1 isoform X2 [Cryptomeria japonica]